MTGSTRVPLLREPLSSRNMRWSSWVEIMSAFTLALAITLTSVATALVEAEHSSPAASRSALGHRTAFSFTARLPCLKVKAGLHYQSVCVGLKTMRVLLRIKTIRIEAVPIAVHEVAFHFHVPESIQVDSRGYDFVVKVIGRKAGVSLGGEQRRQWASGGGGDRVPRVVG